MAETESEAQANLARFIPPRPQENNQFTKPAGFGQSQGRDDISEESLQEDRPARVSRTQEGVYIPPPRPNRVAGKPGYGEDRSTQQGANGPEDR